MNTTATPTAAELARRKPYQGKLLIDGRWLDGAQGRTIDRHSPAHETLVGVYAQAEADDANRAVASARKAFDEGPWPKMKGAERAAILRKAADLILARKHEIALQETLENGKPLAQATAEIEGAADIWMYAATLARTLHGDSYNTLGQDTLGVVLRDPVGVVAIITPWNFPFLIVSQKLPFALAAGCTTVTKPSEFTSGTTLMLHQILLDAGLPPDVANVLVGVGPSVGQALVEHPDVDMVTFTGSTAVGKAATAAAAKTLKKVSLELGGKNPQIVFPDADIEAAIDAVVYGIYFNAGQCCNSGSRVLVHRSIADEFAQAVVKRSAGVKVGDPLVPGVQVGAITTDKQMATILKHVAAAREAGANVSMGGNRIAGTGMFVEPTVVTGVSPQMAIAREEVFGPVLSVLAFDDAAHAVRLANDTLYGLSAAVWSRDISTCMQAVRGIRAGTVWVNTFLEGNPEMPFGGYRESGVGRELGRLAVEDYTETKTVHLHLGERTGWYLPR